MRFDLDGPSIIARTRQEDLLREAEHRRAIKLARGAQSARSRQHIDLFLVGLGGVFLGGLTTWFINVVH